MGRGVNEAGDVTSRGTAHSGCLPVCLATGPSKGRAGLPLSRSPALPVRVGRVCLDGVVVMMTRIGEGGGERWREG